MAKWWWLKQVFILDGWNICFVKHFLRYIQWLALQPWWSGPCRSCCGLYHSILDCEEQVGIDCVCTFKCHVMQLNLKSLMLAIQRFKRRSQRFRRIDAHAKLFHLWVFSVVKFDILQLYVSFLTALYIFYCVFLFFWQLGHEMGSQGLHLH